jgi:hypothetical protein
MAVVTACDLAGAAAGLLTASVHAEPPVGIAYKFRERCAAVDPARNLIGALDGSAQ